MNTPTLTTKPALNILTREITVLPVACKVSLVELNKFRETARRMALHVLSCHRTHNGTDRDEAKLVRAFNRDNIASKNFRNAYRGK